MPVSNVSRNTNNYKNIEYWNAYITTTFSCSKTTQVVILTGTATTTNSLKLPDCDTIGIGTSIYLLDPRGFCPTVVGVYPYASEYINTVASYVKPYIYQSGVCLTFIGSNAWAMTGYQENQTNPVHFQIACSDLILPLTATTSVAYFRAPYAFTLTGVRASVFTAQSSGPPLTIDINESGTTVLSTKLTIDNSEKTSVTAVTASVISDSAIANDSEITIDIDFAGATASGLIVTLIGTNP